ncbi:MAG: grasp-with-spasm system ATP-grasp peptide maturase [Bacteroidetes bacterium]|nr:grasp-with-spasm system ATP-grasp peptide maturase [Bacteroidota bacterium]
MILIISIEDDYSTNDVVDWLSLFNKKVLRINNETSIDKINIESKNNGFSISFTYKNNEYSVNEFSHFWFRKGKLNFDNIIDIISKNNSRDIDKGIYSHLLFEELKTIEQYFIYFLELKNKLGSYYQGDTNKLKSLAIAQNIGLTIPKSFVFSQKIKLIKAFNISNEFITKGIQGILSFGSDNLGFNNKTELINKIDIDEMDNNFFPSFFQKNIPKLYELRIFYLVGEFYSMAIFSQEDEQTKIDFRNYNYENPNRTVPYKLPLQIETRLDLFMKKMDLDTGSIDMIVTPDLEYIFLEVNPVGQYGMTSIPCNYYLDEKIAKYLANEK